MVLEARTPGCILDTHLLDNLETEAKYQVGPAGIGLGKLF